MSFVDRAQRPAPPNDQIPQRHAVYVHAMVTGLGPISIPLFIRDISRRGMYIAFQGHAAAVDERWISVGAAITIAFKATIDGNRRPVKVQAEIRRRDENGIGVRLVTCEASVLAALRSLVIDAMANRGKKKQVSSESVTPPKSPPATGPDQALAACEALLQQLGPAVMQAYLTGLEVALWKTKFTAPLSEQRKIQHVIETFEKARQRSEQTMFAQLTVAFGRYHRGQQTDLDAEDTDDTDGLLLVESSALRVALAIADAVDRIGSLLAGTWLELNQRLAQVILAPVDGSPISPAAICLRLRNALFDDPNLGALRQIDLTDGFTDEFVQHLDALYQELGVALDRLGFHATTKTFASHLKGLDAVR